MGKKSKCERQSKTNSTKRILRAKRVIRSKYRECFRMLSSSISTPFSVRDILSEDQQLGVSMDCYQHHQNQTQQHVHQDYYPYNVVPENNWEMDKFKEHPIPGYQHYSDLNHVHQLSQVVPPYQETSITEDGTYYILFQFFSSCYFMFPIKVK